MKLSHVLAGVFVAALSMLASPTAKATELVDPETHIGINAPDGWKAETGDVLMLSAADESTHMVMLTVDAADGQSALKELAGELDKLIKNAKVDGDATEAEVNGMPCVHISGSGESDGETIHFALAIIDAGDKCLLIVAFGNQEGLEKHSEETSQIFASIHKTE